MVESSPSLSQEDLNEGACVAASGRHADVVRYLLEQGAEAARAPLFLWACRGRSPEVFQAMYDHGWHEEHINKDMAKFPYL